MVLASASHLIDPVNPDRYHVVVQKLRSFFINRGFIEAALQHRQSILAACEDPMTIGTYNYRGKIWPLPQTAQMHLEVELLQNPRRTGMFTVSYSYRQEPDPVPGRHNLIFPMFEFEMPGGIEELRKLEEDLMHHLGIIASGNPVPWVEYTEYASRKATLSLTAEHELEIEREFGPAALLGRFPQHTSPFWNMLKVGDVANKIDVIICGIETIGSAERSCDPKEMRHQFYTISDGLYAKKLFAEFGKERVEEELEQFLALPFIKRCGGGIGMTRLIGAMEKLKLI
jgi:aspartyl/asparaginyl-tRNA synthetase